MARISDPIKIGNLTVSNRLMVPPMTTSFNDTMGYPTEGAFSFYESLARGGWGFIQIEGHAVSWPYGAMNQVQSRLDDDSYIPGLTRIVDILHKHNVPCTVQLMYGGAVAQKWLPRIGFTAKGPSADYLPYGGMFGKVKELTTAECEELIDLWVAAAIRAKKTGADGITIHGSSGNIPQEFLSPMSNHRTDKYGDRLAFTKELVTKLRDAVGPDFLIIFRISSDELVGEKGITVDWMVKEAVPVLEKAGKIDAWDVNPGFMGGPLNGLSPLLYFPSGVNLKYVTPFKSATSKPVIHAGRINDGAFAASLIEEGKLDIVSIGRGALADPQFANKVLAGRYDEVRKCNVCGMACLARDPMKPISCSLNPNFGRPEEDMELKRAEKRKKVIVVGGGLAGMEVATVAATRGHDVTLYEKEAKLGGQAQMGSTFPQLETEDLRVAIDWLANQMAKSGIKVELGKEVTAAAVAAQNADVIVIAAGSSSPLPAIPGADRANAMTLDDYLNRRLATGKKVVVVGGGYGAECAISLSREGKDVTIIEEGPKEKIAVTPYTPLFGARYLFCMQNLAKGEVKTVVQAKVKEITDKGVRYEDEKGSEQVIEADTVIFALPRTPNAKLAEELKGKVGELYTLGDAVRPGVIHDAVHTAFALGKTL